MANIINMSLICKICEKEVEQNHFWLAHKISIEKYFTTNFPKFDLLTNEKLNFKSYENYIFNDFNDRQNLKIYLNRLNPDVARRYILEKLKQRKEIKGLIYGLSQFELRSLMLPAVNYIETKLGGYDNLIKEVGLKKRFNYGEKIKIKENKDLEIIQDTREREPLQLDCRFKIEKLDYADYAAVNNPNKIFIERKSLPDFCGSVTGDYDRFRREIEKAVKDDAYIVILIENSYNQLLTFNELPWIHKTKITPAFVMHRARELNEIYSLNIQMLCIDGKIKAAEMIKKLYLLENNVRNIDLQLNYDLGVI